MAIVLDQFILVEVKASDRKAVKRLTKYLHICDQCNCERGYYIKTFDKYTKNGGLCRSCAAINSPPKSIDTRKKISKSRLGKPTWHGKHSDASIEKMRQAALRRSPETRSHAPLSIEAKKKISCTHRGIDLVDFDDFITNEEEAQRRLFKAQGLHWKCFEKAEYRCDCCNNLRTNKNTLNAHHLNGWHWAKTQRFDLLNLVALCQECHLAFHTLYGRGHNTIEQYVEFKCQKQKNQN